MLTGDAHRADDLVQETLARACAKWALWKPGPKLREWLFTLMHNEHVNAVKSAPPATRSLDSQDDEAIHDARQEIDPGIILDLERALLRLPDDQREILLMIAVEDFSYAEAARVAGVPIGTVMSRVGSNPDARAEAEAWGEQRDALRKLGMRASGPVAVEAAGCAAQGT